MVHVPKLEYFAFSLLVFNILYKPLNFLELVFVLFDSCELFNFKGGNFNKLNISFKIAEHGMLFIPFKQLYAIFSVV